MLAQTVRAVRRAHDIRRVFAALGYEPVEQTLDPGVQVIARWKAYRIIAIDGDVGTHLRSTAHKLARRAERALVTGLSNDGRELHVAAPRFGLRGISRSLVIDIASPSKFSVDQLQRLRPDENDTSLGHALRVVEVLDTEEVGERFFRAFRAILDRMAASLSHTLPPSDRRMTVLLALTRILFLYFVQQKKWLNGQRDYLRRLFDRCIANRRHFHRELLDPLFFGTLNTERAARAAGDELGTIPYLNGGLFEPHPVERRLGVVHFPNELWCDAFDNLFERFHFCVRESETSNAIAPDMLGRVFERLMGDRQRHETGAYYTPESVVTQLVHATLECALRSDLPEELARRLIERNNIPQHLRARASTALWKVRVLDPAVGSGAFLLAALDTLTDLHMHAATMQPTASSLRRRILKRNLFGVDLNPVAVRLTELRLWLSVVAEEPTETIADIHPLPNLDGVVRQGDSLVDPLSSATSLIVHGSSRTPPARAVCSAQRTLFDARGSARRRAHTALRHAEVRLARCLYTEAVRRIQVEVEDLESLAASATLFEQRGSATHAQRRRLQALRKTLKELHRATHQLADGVTPFFSYEVHAPDVLQAGGFSAIIGNPPWVRAEDVGRTRRGMLKERFKWWKSSKGQGWAHLPDLSVAFLERCFELAAPGAAIGLLVPSKLATAAYGEPARSNLVRETTIEYLHRVPQREANRFGATTYPLAIVFRKLRPAAGHVVQVGFGRRLAVSQKRIGHKGPWVLVSRRARDALEEFLDAGVPLREIATPALGVKTGADRILRGTVDHINGRYASVRFGQALARVERTMLRPAIRGRDVRAFDALDRQVVLWGYDDSGRLLSQLEPEAAAYIERCRAGLVKRADYNGGVLWTVFRVGVAFARHRVVWADISRHPRALALDACGRSHGIPLNTCYYVAAPDRRSALTIAAVLNSTWTQAYLRCVADEARGGYRRFNARIAGGVPIPAMARRASVVTISRDAHQRRQYDISRLDECVADALGLSTDARRELHALAADHS